MTKQLSTLVSTQWLLPLFNEQLNEVHQLWDDAYHSAEAKEFATIAQSYHNFVGALDVANLAVFWRLGVSIEVFLQGLATGAVPIKQALIPLYASELLQYELNSYAKIGEYQTDLLIKRSGYLTHLLEHFGVDVSAIYAKNSSVPDNDAPQHSQHDSRFNSADLLSSIQIPPSSLTQSLTPAQLESLIAAWRHSVQQLLKINANDTALLTRLERIAKYLLSDASLHELTLKQALWYITALWFEALTQNTDPKPSIYAHILSDLDAVISLMQAEQVELELEHIKPLMVEIYIQLSGLKSVPEATVAVIEDVDQNLNSGKQFLPRVLDRLEKLIFMLDTPFATIEPLQQLQTLLDRRGWYMFKQQIEQVLQELYAVEQMPESYESTRWQIERQLQELYGTMLNSVETIDTQIGQGQLVIAPTQSEQADTSKPDDKSNFATQSTHDAMGGVSGSGVGVDDAELDSSALRKVRIAVEEIKTAFGDFLKTHAVEDLPQEACFETLHDAFAQIQFYDVVEVIEQCERVFNEIKEYSLAQLTWRLTDTIADSLALLELFLDYLAQQTLDLTLLTEALEGFESARTLLIELSQSPEMAEDTPPVISTALADDAPRYDDTGEIDISVPDDDSQQGLGAQGSQSNDSDDDIASDDIASNDIAGVKTDSTHTDGADEFDAFDHDTVINMDDSDDSIDAIFDTHLDADEGDSDLNDTKLDTKPDDTAENNQALPAVVENKSLSSTVIDSPQLQEARSILKDDNFDMDEEISEIFIEEAEEVLQALEDHLPVWQDNLQDLEPLSEIRRGFHTLKGSGRMVGAYTVAEMAWAVENLLNRVLDHTLVANKELLNFILATKALIPALMTDFSQKRAPSIDPALTIVRANNLLKGNPIDQGLEGVQSPDTVDINDVIDADAEHNRPNTDATDDATSDTSHVSADAPVINDNDDIESIENINDDDIEVINQDTASSQDTIKTGLPDTLAGLIDKVELPQDDEDADEDIKEIFIEEAGEVLAHITPIFKKWHSDDEAGNIPLTELRRGFHTLKGSGRMVGAFYMGELAWTVENMLNRILDNTIEVTPDIVALLGDVLKAYPNMVATFEAGASDYPSIAPLWAVCAKAYSKGLADSFDYQTVKSAWLATTSQSVADTETEAQTQTDTETHTQDNISKPVINADLVQEKSTLSQSTAPSDRVLKSIQTANVKLADANLPLAHADEEAWAFYEIFLEEAEELVDVIKRFIKDNQAATNIVVDDEVVRAFHTLRGAAGSESLKEVGEISGTVEHSLKLLQQHEEPISPSHLQVLEQSVMLIEQYINQFKHENLERLHKQTVDSADTQLHTDAAHLQAPVDPIEIEEGAQVIDAVKQMFDNSMSVQFEQEEFDIAETIGHDIEDLLDAQWEITTHFNTDAQPDKITQYAKVIRSQIEKLSVRVAKSATFMSLLSALHGVHKKIETQPSLVKQEVQGHNQVVDTLISGHDALTQLFDALAGSMSLNLSEVVLADLHAIAAPTPVESLLATDLSNATEDTTDKASVPLEIEPITTDIELLEIFLEEAQELDDSIHETFATWQKNPQDLDSLKVLQRHLHTVKGGARMAGISSIGDLTHEAETIYELFVNGKLTPTQEWVNVMQRVQDVLSQLIEYAVNHHQSIFVTELVAQLKQLAHKDELPDHVALKIPLITNKSAQTEEPPQETEESLQTTAAQEFDAKFQSMVSSSWGDAHPDKDILSVFLEEAHEIIEDGAQYLNIFRSNTSDISALQKLQRDLHTIKGGARMVPANGIADLAHQMETVYEDLASRRRPPTKLVGQLLEACHDWLANAVSLLEYNINPPLPNKLIEALKRFSKNPDSLERVEADSLHLYQDLIEEYEAQQKVRTGYYSIDEPPPIMGGFSQTQEQSTLSNEMIRISSSLMERMINLSGESAINRARIDMGISSLTHTIEEMGVTVQRLADQLRRMDIELEAQILAQIDDEELLGQADFDPLEMDQYSSLNQLSKSLSESASDLIDIKTTMLDKTRDSESLLLQLSRTQAELQDGLMNSRMVPFSRLTPRLQRIVRQTANELNKSVELKIINADDEMDRTILERITSPLEHMLRNAVDHGIELPKDRERLGKPRTGLIELEVMREGSEVVIHLTDDGSGIDVDAVRNKAISQGLIDPNDTSLTDLDVMQYIFNAGLTTTNKVTQISGRGVGMDVVLNEIRQLGGIVSVESKENEGSRFSMRVPLTVAISDALVVRVGDSYYAIPLVQIERVVRVNPERLYDFYQSDASTLEIDGIDYRLRYLNEILRGTGLNKLSVHTNLSLPVIIVKNQTDQQLAIQVDEVAGSRIEVVVKPLGRQLSHASGISAATIMADGSVMLILDLMALLRNAPARAQLKVNKDKDGEQKLKTILIVDDSVTVRKVTSRLLERQGYATLVAKDGIDAVEILQEVTPDLMLLDIEMPRMDGFEVATQVRHDSTLKDIPIIMITSRTGDKHRERAFEVGVNDYLGKPYQETQLLQTVKNLLGQSVHD